MVRPKCAGPSGGHVGNHSQTGTQRKNEKKRQLTAARKAKALQQEQRLRQQQEELQVPELDPAPTSKSKVVAYHSESEDWPQNPEEIRSRLRARHCYRVRGHDFVEELSSDEGEDPLLRRPGLDQVEHGDALPDRSRSRSRSRSPVVEDQGRKLVQAKICFPAKKKRFQAKSEVNGV